MKILSIVSCAALFSAALLLSACGGNDSDSHHQPSRQPETKHAVRKPAPKKTATKKPVQKMPAPKKSVPPQQGKNGKHPQQSSAPRTGAKTPAPAARTNTNVKNTVPVRNPNGDPAQQNPPARQ